MGGGGAIQDGRFIVGNVKMVNQTKTISKISTELKNLIFTRHILFTLEFLYA